MPKLKFCLEKHQDKTKRELEKCSPLSGKLAQKELIKLCRDFVDEIRKGIEDRPQPIRQAYKRLADDLSKTRLKFDVSQDRSESDKNGGRRQLQLGDPADPVVDTGTSF